MDTEEPKWDVFISHAWEDKDDFVRPLAEALQVQGVKVWYDEFTIELGDDLRTSMDAGLAKSRYGVIVISSAFLEKASAIYELNVAISRQISGNKVILPIWHNITREEIMKYSPMLADIVSISTTLGISTVVKTIMQVIAKPLLPPSTQIDTKPQWDVFISHAWEDKDSFVRPLAEALQVQGVKVWYDEFRLILGDSSRNSISIGEGLANSQFGIFVFSKAFIEKWSAYELGALVHRHRQVSGKMILPIWHNITRADMMKYSPSLADLVAISTSRGLSIVVQEIMKVLRKFDELSQPTPLTPEPFLPPPFVTERKKLLNALTTFDKSELKRICFELNIIYEDFDDHDILSGLAIGLIGYMEKFYRISELKSIIKTQRPNADI